MVQLLACVAPINDQPGSSTTQGNNLETQGDGLVICHDPSMTLTLTFPYTSSEGERQN